jgi:LPS-assembly protein
MRPGRGPWLWLLLLTLMLPAAVRAQAQESRQAAALIADRVRVEGDSRLVAEGSVEVLYGGTRLKAARITYDRQSGRLAIEGPITLVDDAGTVVLADSAMLDSDLTDGILTSARVVLDQQLQLAAAELRRVGGRYTEMAKVVASACQVCAAHPVALWSIRARRVIHDQQERQLCFDHATIRVMDIPVFWLPRLRLPDPTLKRATGFLLPGIRSTSQLGFGVKVPYFVAIGASRDLTFTPYLSPHTRTLELRYRQALRSGGFSFNAALSHDDIEPDDTRGYLFGAGSFRLENDFRLSFGIETVSDPAYLLDYGYSDDDRLQSFVRLERVRRTGRVALGLTSFHTLRDSEIAIEDTLPYLLGAALWERRFLGLGGGIGRLAFSLQGHQRTSSTDVEGRDVLRLGLLAEWQRSGIFGPGIEASAIARLTADRYFVRQDPNFRPDFGQVTPAVAVTLRWPLVRHSAGGVSELLQPMLQLAWSERRGTLPPNEDSTLVEFDTGNLLSLDRYPGRDRQEDGWRAALGFAWTRHDPAGWSLGVTVGRIFRLDEAGFSAASGLGGTRSDWLAAFNLAFGRHLVLASRTLIGDGFDISKSETRLDWIGDRFNLGAAYVWIVADAAEGRTVPTHELSFDTDYRFAPRWTARAGMRYDIQADRAASARLGLAFRNECITLDLSLSRRFTSSTSVTPTTDVGLKVSLDGFGRDGRDYRGSCRG